MPRFSLRRLAALSALLVMAATTLAGAAGCSAATAESAGSPADGALAVVTSFYPLEFAVEQVGGAHVRVRSLTKPGTEPHDVELTPHDVGAVSKADLVVYARGFQPAVDTAVDQEGSTHAFDVAPTANLDLAAPAEGEEGHPDHGPAADPSGGSASGTAASVSGTTGPASAKDPHFWLDPQRYAAVAVAIGAQLAHVDAAHAADYTANAARFVGSLTTLDGELEAGLATCTNRALVTSHAAFGYLGERYGFTQVSISGLSPDMEPSAQRLAEIADFVQAHHVSTIYAETLVEPAFAQTVSRSTGATVATLDPIEGLTSSSAGRSYLEVMRSNLATLRAGQGCS